MSFFKSIRPELPQASRPNVPYLLNRIAPAPGAAAVALLKRTKWLHGNQYPVRTGWYERNYSIALINDPRDAGLRFDYFEVIADQSDERFPGKWYTFEPEFGLNEAYYQELPWRGVQRHRDALLSNNESTTLQLQ